MAATLTHVPVLESTLSKEVRVKSISFGNGYEQFFPDGINANPDLWNMVFDEDDAGKQTLIAFFEANKYTYFNYTSPETGAVQKQFTCRKWSFNFLGAGNYKIMAEFKEWYGLT